MRRSVVLPAVMVCACALGVWPAQANAQIANRIEVRVESQPLEDALQRLAREEGIDVVFAGRLVAGRTSTCTYLGRDVKAALDCLLDGTGLRAEWFKADQAVIRRGPAIAQPEPEPVRRSVRGQVIDGESGDPLPGAHVRAVGASSGDVTNIRGQFTLDAELTGASIEVSYLGYESATVSLQSDVTVTLERSGLVGDEIVVERAASEPALDDALANVRMITLDEPARTRSMAAVGEWFQSMLWQPGVQRSAELGGNLIVRGALPDQNLFLLDGAPVYQPRNAGGQSALVQSAALEAVHLYTDALPAEFGGRLSAVVDARTRTGLGGSPSMTAALTSSGGQLAMELPFGQRTSLAASGRRSLFGTPSTPAGRIPLTSDAYHDLHAKLTHAFSPGHRLSVSAYRSGDNLRIDQEALTPTATLSGTYHWSNEVLSLHHDVVASDRFLVSSHLYRSSYTAFDETNVLRVMTGSEFGGGDGVASPSEEPAMSIQDLGAKVTVDYFAKGPHMIRTGAEIVHHRFDWPYDPSQPWLQEGFRAIEAAVFAEDTWTPVSRLAVKPGLRIGFYSGDLNMHVLPRLSSSLVLVPGRLSAHASVSRQVQYIHQVQSADSDYAFSRWHAVNAPDVEPAVGLQFTAGIEAQPTDSWSLTADVYQRHAENVLLPGGAVNPLSFGKVQQTASFAETFDQGATRAYGLEFLTSYTARGWRAWAGYAASRAMARPEVYGAAFMSARFEAPHTVRGAVEFASDRWHWGISGEARSGYVTSPLASADPVRLPVYLRLDAGFGYRFELGPTRWNALVHIYNLTNRANVVGYRDNLDGSSLSGSIRNGIPRWPTFRIELAL
ncbi:MAG: TonB-dependent receptor [Bacteroidota bacterium]